MTTLEVNQAVHQKQLADHDSLLKELTAALQTLTTKLASFERKALIALIAIFGGREVGLAELVRELLGVA